MSYDNHIVNRALALRMNHLFHKPDTLIIDDEKDICFLLSNILKQRDMHSVYASSLSEADDIIGHTSAFSFIFIDNHLPDGLGVEFIKHIKERYPSCKVIMITAHDTQADREKASYEGADYFISKPFSRELILSAIDKFTA